MQLCHRPVRQVSVVVPYTEGDGMGANAETNFAEVLFITQEPVQGTVPLVCYDSAVTVCSGTAESDFLIKSN